MISPETLSALYPISAWVYFAIAIIIFTLLFLLNAPYGRHLRANWGPQMPAITGWVVMEMPALVMPTLLLMVSDTNLNPVTLVFFILWHIHYIHRTLIYTWQRRNDKKQFPIVVCALGFIFNIVNGYIVSWGIYALYPIDDINWFSSIPFILGTCIFFIGMWINISSDRILLRLRSHRLAADKDIKFNGEPQPDHYVIPDQGMHRFVASPNYLGEIIEWLGFAIATFSIGGALFVLFTFANLAPRAFANLKWYRARFPDYPPKRKALIPFVI